MCLLAVMFVLASGDALAAKDSKNKSKAKSKTRSVAGKAVWKTDIKAAIAEAQKSKKQILVLLTGSDWCGYCMKLDKAVFSHKSFPALAKNPATAPPIPPVPTIRYFIDLYSFSINSL